MTPDPATRGGGNSTPPTPTPRDEGSSTGPSGAPLGDDERPGASVAEELNALKKRIFELEAKAKGPAHIEAKRRN